MNAFRRAASLGLAVFLLFASDKASSEAGDLASLLANLKRDIDLAAAQYRGCTDFPCPDVNCQSHQAATAKLGHLAALLGDPRVMAGQADPVKLGENRKTLAYWIDRQRAASTLHYQNLLDTYATNEANAKVIEIYADVQKWLILTSKTAQIAGDVAGLTERMSGLLATNPATLDWAEYMKVADSIAVATTNMIESAEIADAVASRLAGQTSRVKTPPGLSDFLAKAQTGREVVVATQSLRDFKRSLGDLRAEEAALRRRGINSLDSLAPKRAAMLTAGRAATFSGLNVATKYMTMVADSQQAEMRERIAELKRNLPKEAQVLLESAAELEASSAAWQELVALSASLRAARHALSTCDAACEAQVIPPGQRVPVEQFLNKEQNTESHGAALLWFEATLTSLQRPPLGSEDLKIRDGKVKLDARPPEVATEEVINIAYSGSLCLLRSGKIGDAEGAVRTEPSGGIAQLHGKSKSGDYTFSYTPTGYRAGAHSEHYRSNVVVRVGKSPLIGYWERNGKAQIRNGRGEVVDWPEAPAGLLVGEAGTSGMRAVHLWPRMKASDFPAYFNTPKLACQSRERSVICRHEERETKCGLQWYSYHFEVLDTGAGRLAVDGGEIPSEGVDGCVAWPHVFLPMNYELRRAAVDSPLILKHPCPADVRCR